MTVLPCFCSHVRAHTACPNHKPGLKCVLTTTGHSVQLAKTRFILWKKKIPEMSSVDIRPIDLPLEIVTVLARADITLCVNPPSWSVGWSVTPPKGLSKQQALKLLQSKRGNKEFTDKGKFNEGKQMTEQAGQKSEALSPFSGSYPQAKKISSRNPRRIYDSSGFYWIIIESFSNFQWNMQVPWSHNSPIKNALWIPRRLSYISGNSVEFMSPCRLAAIMIKHNYSF